jgi:methionyl-tRNA formyltransferase
MEQPRIAILCGGPSAFQSIQILALEKYLCGIAIASEESEAADQLEKEAKQLDLPFEKLVTRADLTKLDAWMEAAQPDAVFSIGFPYRIPAALLEKVPNKFINFHHGPLPKYRGAMPIFEVLRAGEAETAISVHLMDAEFDEGAVVFQEPIAIDEHETFGSLAVKIADTFMHQRPVKLVAVSIAEAGQTTAQPGTILQLEPNAPVQVACVGGEVLNIHIVSNEYGVLPSHYLGRQRVLTGHIFKQ